MPIPADREALLETLCALAAKQGDVPASGVSASTHLFNDLNYDSLDALELVMLVEEEYEISIPDEDAEKIRTVADALGLLMNMRAGQASTAE